MSSIFIWKSETPNKSDKKITYYNGPNWFLEEHSSYSKSYNYINQYAFITITTNVLCFEAKEMPTDWTGNYLLEKWSEIPYSLLKDDEYATFEEKQLEKEWIKLQTWLKEPIKKSVNIQNYPKNRMNTYEVPIKSIQYTQTSYKNKVYNK